MASTLVALAAIAYGGTLGYGFVYDDLASIVQNPDVHGLSAFLSGGYAGRPNRLVAYLTFAANYDLAGLAPGWYRAINVAIHVINATLVYALVRVAFRTPLARRSSVAPAARTIGFAAAALFVAHPIQTQAVTYIVQRIASLATTFYVGTVVSYSRWRLAGEEGVASRRRRVLGYVPVVLLALVAVRTKEVALTLPVTVAVYDLVLFEWDGWRWLAARLSPLVAAAILVPWTVLSAAPGVSADTAGALERASRVQTALSRATYLRTELTVLARYLGLLVVPVGQNVDPDVPLQPSWAGPAVVASALLFCGLAALAAWLLVRSRATEPRPLDPAARVVVFGTAWFFIAHAVESSVIPIVDVMNEHRVYLPSVGFFTAVAAAGAWALRSVRPDQANVRLAAVALGVAGVLVAATASRNQVWRDELSLWSDAARKSPRKSRPHNNVAAALIDAGRPLEAEPWAERSVALDPSNLEARLNLGRVEMDLGRYGLAEATFRNVIQARPSLGSAYADLSGVLNRTHRYRETVTLLEGSSVLAVVPEARFNLSVAYAALGLRAPAMEQARALRAQSPALAARLDRFLADTERPGRR